MPKAKIINSLLYKENQGAISLFIERFSPETLYQLIKLKKNYINLKLYIFIYNYFKLTNKISNCMGFLSKKKFVLIYC